MDTHDWITAASAVLVTIGWFVTGYLSRRNAIALKRLDVQIQAYRSFVTFWSAFELALPAPFSKDPTLSDKLRAARIEFQLYCSEGDNVAMNDLVLALERRDIPATEKAISCLLHLAANNIRRSVKLSELGAHAA